MRAIQWLDAKSLPGWLASQSCCRRKCSSIFGNEELTKEGVAADATVGQVGSFEERAPTRRDCRGLRVTRRR